MADLIIAVILLAIVGAAARYVIKAKKSGAKCIGCSVEGGCPNHSQGQSQGCGCGCGSGKSSCGCHPAE